MSIAVVLVAAGAAWASSPSKEKIAYTTAGRAKAKAEVLRRADVGKGWQGGARKPDVSSALPCSYKPKQNDLVPIGAAATYIAPATAAAASSIRNRVMKSLLSQVAVVFTGSSGRPTAGRAAPLRSAEPL